MKIFKISFLVLFLSALFTQNASAQQFEVIKARIVNKTQTSCENAECTIFELELLEGESKREVVETKITDSANTDPQAKYLNTGDTVFLQQYSFENQTQYVIQGPVRDVPIFFLVFIFIVIVLFICKLQGLGSIIGLGISIFILFGVTTPMILNGTNAILAGYMGAFLVLITSIFLSHGITKKSMIALASSMAGLVIISILTAFFIGFAKLNGFGDNESLSLLSQTGGNIDLRGILFASIIFGRVVVLDDISVNQVSALFQIYKTNQNQDWLTLYNKAMILGRDHISSLVNTLFIAYASASMPMMMLLQSTDSSFYEIINSDQFAEEIVRTFLASIGLVLVVPISSALAAFFVKKYGLKKHELDEIVHHTH